MIKRLLMKYRRSQAFLIGLVTFTVGIAGNVVAQPWSGILNPTRAIDWRNAGVVGGIPSDTWVQCGSTIAAGASASTINAAIQNCGLNQYVKLGPGTFNLSTGLVMKSNVVIRGMGADQTFLVFSGTNTCAGAYAAVCFGGGDSSDYFGSSKVQSGATNAATWTAGYGQGTTQITLSGIGTSGITVGKYIFLDQAEDTATNSGFFVCESTSASPPCSAEGGAGDPGRVISGIARQQIQIVKVTACSPSCTSGSTFTISPGIYAPNYASAKSPGAWWPSSTIQNAGIEELSLDATNSSGNANIELYNAMNVWVKGTRQIRSCACNRSIIQMHAVAHATIQNNYFYGTTGQSQNYGVESYIASDNLVVNNIFQHVVTPMMVHSNTGSVYAYNYAINDTYDDGGSPQYHYMANAIAGHSAGVMYNLFEGNIGPGMGGDAIHGNQVMNTLFRNYLLGRDPNRIDATVALNLESWNRYWNVIGNVLGSPRYSKSYTGSNSAIYALGGGRSSVPNDSLVATTMMRWGNWDVVSNATRWCGNSGNTGWSSTCSGNSEVPTGVNSYPNAVPATETLPASFYLTTKPGWWPTSNPWPAIGPDVTGGDIPNLAGHAYTTPARDCYGTVMGGPADGSGSVLRFNANSCYGAPAATPAPPTNVGATSSD